MKRKVLVGILTMALLTTVGNSGQVAAAQNLGDGESIESPVSVMEAEENVEVLSEDTQTEENVEVLSEDTQAEENVEMLSEDTQAEENVEVLSEDTQAENMEMLQESMEEDPQEGTSMSNTQLESVSEWKGSSLSYSGYTGNTYTHNARFDDGYRIVNGIDVSYHNGTIDWSAVKASGIDYAIIRVGYRGLSNGNLFDDSMYRTNIQGALNAGLEVGVYIFSQAITQAEAIAEADYVLNRISGYNITLPVVIDYEYGTNNTGRLADANLDIDTATGVVSAFCSRVQAAGYTPMIYANKSMLQSSIRGEVLDDYYKIWVANYTTRTTYAGDYYAWQYSSKGFINGINGYVDCDFFYEKENLQNSQMYVTRLYQNLLERDPDDSGLNNYVQKLSAGRATAADIALDIISSDEFKDKNYSNEIYVYKLYAALFGRTAQEAEVDNWKEILANGVSEQYVLKQVVGSAEFATVCSYYNIVPGNVELKENRDYNYDATAYVMRCYQKILGRNADVSGLNTWTGKLKEGNGGAEIVKDLVVSDEFENMQRTDEEFIDILYEAMLDRASDADGKASWVSVLEAGVSRVYVINGFAGSKEFGNICADYGITPGQAEITEARDKNLQVTQYVGRCYEKALGRSGETAGINDWCSIILNKIQSPKDVACGFVFSAESINQERNNAEFVEMLYNLCLGRESDEEGKADWVNRLNQGTSRETVYWGFANSSEFENIIAGYGL